MVDPVGTGYSRAIGEAEGKDFWGVDNDIRSVLVNSARASATERESVTANTGLESAARPKQCRNRVHISAIL